MPWRELQIDAQDGLVVFTTAELEWRPLASEDPEGAQIAMLWGDRSDPAFGALVRLRTQPPVYALMRRSVPD